LATKLLAGEIAEGDVVQVRLNKQGLIDFSKKKSETAVRAR